MYIMFGTGGKSAVELSQAGRRVRILFSAWLAALGFFVTWHLHDVLWNTNASLIAGPLILIVVSYAHAGHYYTVYWTSLSAGLPPPVAFRNAFFAQMPDQVLELDAIAREVVYLMQKPAALYLTVFSGVGVLLDSLWKRGRNEAQILLHALSGGKAGEELDKTKAALNRVYVMPSSPLFGVLCHRLGDCFSHRKIKAPDSMYEPGLGHGWPISEGVWPTTPDSIDTRPNGPELYAEYCRNLFEVCSDKVGPSDCDQEPVYEYLDDFVAEAELIGRMSGEEAQIGELRSRIDEIGKHWQTVHQTPFSDAYRPESEVKTSSLTLGPTGIDELHHTMRFELFESAHEGAAHRDATGGLMEDPPGGIPTPLKVVSDVYRELYGPSG